MTATALTFKKGQVLGPDGQVYDGASPQLRARLVAEAEAGGRSAGVAAGQLFVVVQGTVTFVPLTEIAGKSEEVVKDIVVEKVTQTVTKALTVEALANAGVEVENLSEEALEAASEGDIAAALDEIANADVAGVYGPADAALTPFVSRLHELAMDWMWDDRPHVAAWWDTVRDRDSFGTVFDAFPDPRRKAGLRAAGEETREAAERILSGSPCR